MNRQRRPLLEIASVFCLATVGLATPASAQSRQELYAKAKAEGALDFYSGGPIAPYERFISDFKKQFPGIAVSITGGFSNVLNAKINDQLRAKKLAVDMAFFQTVQDFVAWKRQGVLLDFKPEGYSEIAPEFRDPDGAYTTVKVSAITYAYNTKLVAPADVPKSALDFLKPIFAGKLITCYPADDDATLYLFYTIVQKYGWSYMDKYMANKPNFVQGHLSVARSVGDGANAATFDGTSTADAVARTGKPIKSVFSARRSDATVHADCRPLQGRAASLRGQAVPELVHGEGTTEPARRLLAAHRRTAASRSQAARVLQGRQRLP